MKISEEMARELLGCIGGFRAYAKLFVSKDNFKIIEKRTDVLIKELKKGAGLCKPKN